MAGIGLGILLEEFELLDPSSPLGLAFPIGGILLGLILALMRRHPAPAPT